MKTIFTIFIFSFFIFNSKAQWVELDPGVNVPYFSDVYAITPDIVVVVGANGTILKTTDGGETWYQKPSGTANGLNKVQFPTPDIGYIIGDSGVLLKTMDGGETWDSIDTGNDSNFSGLSCVDENLIFTSINNNVLLKTEDGGNTWVNFQMNSFNDNYVQFFDNSLGYTSLQSGSLYKTEDGGITWDEFFGVAPYYFINESVGFYYEGGLLKTIEGGNNFQYLGFGTGEYLSAILAINDNIIWGIFEGLLDGDGTTRGLIKITYSDSQPYTEEIWYDNNSEMNMSAIHFADETIGYIVGFNQEKGTIWKNETGINTMDTNEQERNNEIKVYPNPVSNELNIIFEKPIKANITLTDITGKQIYSKSFHENQVKINTSAFPKGTYILSVKTETKNVTKKIIIN
ncbi:MAG: YCF48-related protein [Moheibacter sp.]